jgi:hypothetical protein
MPIVFADRVKVRTRTNGTGTLTLENTIDGFQSFEAVGNGNQTYYGIEHPNGTWEIGLGTYTSAGSTLSRDTVLSSSNSNALVDFTGGSKNVFVTIPSSVAANIIASTTFAFRDIAVSGQTTVSADSTADTLTLVAGTGIGITTNASTDTITITGTNTGAIEFAGSTISTSDSSAIAIDQTVTLESNVNVGGDLLPKIDMGGSLGSPSRQWKELFVSTGSIYIGNVKLSNNAGKLEITKVIRPGQDDEEPEDDNAGDSVTSKLTNGIHEFVLESDGTLTLDGDPFTGGGGSNSYTPEDEDNWDDPTVTTVQAALDELAARVTALQNFEIDGGNAYTPPQGEFIIDGNGA